MGVGQYWDKRDIMSGTIRIYNRVIKKCHRDNLDDGIARHIKDMDFSSSLRNAIHHYGFPFIKFGQICMGKCKACRNRKLDQKYQRKIRNREFQQIVKLELRKSPFLPTFNI